MVEAMRMTLIKAKGAEELENFVFQRMAESGFVGLSIATIEEGELNYKRGFGFRDFDRGTSVTPETTYCIGSVTKPFTALAVMQLHEKGLLSLDDPVEKHIPFKVRPMGEPILVKHLLSHSSGLANLGYAEVTLSAITDASAQWFPISSPQDLLVFMNGAEDWAVSKPGQRYGYLNEGYILLGMIIEEASGVAYADYVKESILDPLGMSRSTFREDEVEKDGERCHAVYFCARWEKGADEVPLRADDSRRGPDEQRHGHDPVHQGLPPGRYVRGHSCSQLRIHQGHDGAEDTNRRGAGRGGGLPLLWLRLPRQDRLPRSQPDTPQRQRLWLKCLHVLRARR